jgi:hypothetical protein
MLKPELILPNEAQLFDERLELVDHEVRDLLAQYMVALGEWVRQMSSR